MQIFKDRFLVKNIIRGIIWLLGFVILYVIGKKYIDVNYLAWLEPVYDNKTLMLAIFLVSEIVIGIIPPELFVIWAFRHNNIHELIMLTTILAVISYLAGLLGFLIGRFLNTTLFYRFFRRRFLTKMESQLEKYGIYLIIIAALTPVPYSGVSMLVGSARYSLKKFLFISLTRFLRFIIYAYLVVSVN
jgi:membrane protein YqaA with SNARE-associated domain